MLKQRYTLYTDILIKKRITCEVLKKGIIILNILNNCVNYRMYLETKIGIYRRTIKMSD